MELLSKSLVSFWGEPPNFMVDSLKFIEKAGRVCYKSEEKIDDDSYIKFCKMLCDRGHTAMLEHSWIVYSTVLPVSQVPQVLAESKFIYQHWDGGKTYFAGNYRAWIECLQKVDDKSTWDYLRNITSHISNTFTGFKREVVPDFLKAYTVKFTTDRAVTHELVRHRPASYAQLSQRYVASDGDIKFLLPWWLQDVSLEEEFNEWYSSMLEVEKQYHKLRRTRIPQEARVILPNCTVTEIIVTAPIWEWELIFDLRTARGAYPPMREMMSEFKQTLYESLER